MAKDLNMALFFDFYGNMLTEKQQDILELYYNEDLSLGEISEQLGITRQGVHDSIKRSEKQLAELEDKLGLSARFRVLSEKIEEIEKTAEFLNTLELKDKNRAQLLRLKDKLKEVLELL